MSTATPSAPLPTWPEVRAQLETVLGETPMAMWFPRTTGQIGVAGDGSLTLRLTFPNIFHKNYVLEQHASKIERFWAGVSPHGVVHFLVDEALMEAGPPAAAAPPARPETIVQLDFWDDGKRAAPNAVFRSALFPALHNQTRKFIKEQTLCAVQGITVIFTGEQFDQSDLDVYLELLNIARPFPLGTPVTFTAYSLLRDLGRQTGNTNHKWLHSVLIRLCGGVVEMIDHNKRYFGHLVDGGMKDELTKHYEISINPKLAVLFGFGMWATLDRGQRNGLGRHWTAKALHAYYATHAGAGPHRFETLAGIVGLTDKNPRKVRMKLKDAHDLLASKEIGFLTGYTVDDDTIEPMVNHAPSQVRHLTRRRAQSAGRVRVLREKTS